MTYSAKKIEFVLGLPIIFTTVWALNHLVRVFDGKNDIFYYPILILNITFELHLVVTTILFYIVFDGFLKINQIWINLWEKVYCCRRKKVYEEDC